MAGLAYGLEGRVSADKRTCACGRPAGILVTMTCEGVGAALVCCEQCFLTVPLADMVVGESMREVENRAPVVDAH